MNASESLNEELKSWVDREKSTMTGFNEKFENLRAAQEKLQPSPSRTKQVEADVTAESSKTHR